MKSDKGNSSEQVAVSDQVFTDVQIAAWRKYEKVRSMGVYNMLDSRARQLTGLSSDTYHFVLNNYSELQAAALPKEAK